MLELIYQSYQKNSWRLGNFVWYGRLASRRTGDGPERFPVVSC